MRFRALVLTLTLTLLLAFGIADTLTGGLDAAAQSVRPPDNAVNVETTAGGSVRPPEKAETNAPATPGVTRERDQTDEINPAKAETPLVVQGPNSSTTLWGEIRHGAETSVSIPDPQAAILMQDAGMGWLELRAKGGPLQVYGGYAMGGIVVLLVLFYAIRGRIRVDSGLSGMTIERFRALERFGHWLLAGSFILLALTGLNLLYGKDYLMPLIGKEAFASVSMAGKWVHNNVAWAFMLAIVLVFFMWVLHNLPSRHDLGWIAKGGGLFVKGVHPPARKFNAGQKLIFWSVIVLGGSISLSGLSLLFPYDLPMFGKTFVILNDLGISQLVVGAPLATDLTAIQEMQYAQVWHTIVAFTMIFIVIAHIYIGSVGMQGAFAAMGSGLVDRNWAKEHHGIWVNEVDAKTAKRAAPSPDATPAE